MAGHGRYRGTTDPLRCDFQARVHEWNLSLKLPVTSHVVFCGAQNTHPDLGNDESLILRLGSLLDVDRLVSPSLMPRSILNSRSIASASQLRYRVKRELYRTRCRCNLDATDVELLRRAYNGCSLVLCLGSCFGSVPWHSPSKSLTAS